MPKFSHLGLLVTDLERSVRFYTEIVGLELIERHPDSGRGLEIAFVGDGRGVLELLAYKDPEKRGRTARGRYDHLAWFVDDLRQVMSAMAAKGVVFEAPEPIVVLDGRQINFFSGPDGERIELVQQTVR